MQRYYLFGGLHYYPRGGVTDFQMSVVADSLSQARQKMDFSGVEWWQIALIEQGVIRILAEGNIDKETELEGMH
jgi:hypothetical protein